MGVPSEKKYTGTFLIPMPVSEVWGILSNTDHLNRTVGLPPVSYTMPGGDGLDLPRLATARFGPFRVEWREFPFEWVKESRYSVVREFARGPLSRFIAGAELKAVPEGTLVEFSIILTPRNLFYLPIVKFLGWKGTRDAMGYCRKIAALAAEKAPDALPRLAQPKARVKEARTALGKVVTEAPGASDGLLASFQNHLVRGTDDEVVRMQPYALAEKWGTGRRETLRLFLYAASEGVLDLDWELMCPNCRVPKASVRSLKDVPDRVHCELCGIDFDLDMSSNTELRFSVSARVRVASQAVYCLAGPANSPHIVAQAVLAPGEMKQFDVSLGKEAFRCRILRRNESMRLMPLAAAAPTGDAGNTIRLGYSPTGWAPEAVLFTPGKVGIEWKNEGPESVTLVLERVKWDSYAATAAEVTALPEFRSQFSSEVLAPGRQLGIRTLCVLFTDLKQSTQFYERVGDAPAFGVVQRHFDYLSATLERNNGHMVKTIGDAVMGVFPTAADGVRAALEIQTGLAEFCNSLPRAEELVIKVGLHQGPAICMNANGQIDYFGRTVNIASRIQNESVGGDIIITEELVKDPVVQQILKKARFRLFSRKTKLKGIEGEFKLYRIVPGVCIIESEIPTEKMEG